MPNWKTARAMKAKPAPEKLGRRALLVIAIQILLVVLFAFELFDAVKIGWKERTIDFSQDPSVYIMLCLIALALYSINFVAKKRKAKVYGLQAEVQSLIKDTAQAKIRRSRENPFTIALLMIEIVYVLVLAGAIYLYFDPDPNLNNDWLLGWLVLLRKSGADVQPPLSDALKIITFAAITGLFLYMHSHALKFDALDRHARKRKIEEKKKKKK
ncbi:MAG: hypothetical protein NT067_00755 [Candidatus Diapherotrites archaeon]|nr:hypothetical protein [Candidatus Diapherotrites archaeon]